MPNQTPNLSIRRLRARYLAGELAPADVLAEIHGHLDRHSDNPIWIHVLSDADLAPYLKVPFAFGVASPRNQIQRVSADMVFMVGTL